MGTASGTCILWGVEPKCILLWNDGGKRQDGPGHTKICSLCCNQLVQFQRIGKRNEIPPQTKVTLDKCLFKKAWGGSGSSAQRLAFQLCNRKWALTLHKWSASKAKSRLHTQSVGKYQVWIDFSLSHGE